MTVARRHRNQRETRQTTRRRKSNWTSRNSKSCRKESLSHQKMATLISHMMIISQVLDWLSSSHLNRVLIRRKEAWLRKLHSEVYQGWWMLVTWAESRVSKIYRKLRFTVQMLHRREPRKTTLTWCSSCKTRTSKESTYMIWGKWKMLIVHIW